MFDALLKSVPDSPWVTIAAFVILAYLLVERVTNFGTSVVDRRSDKQLLDQAEKAAQIMTMLPEAHSSRTALLHYIGGGPVGELSKRQTRKVARQEKAQKRKKKLPNILFSSAGTALLFVLQIPAIAQESHNYMFTGDNLPSERFWIVTSVWLGYLVSYTFVWLILYLFTRLVDCVGDWGERQVNEWRAKNNARRQEREGIGGVYEI